MSYFNRRRANTSAGPQDRPFSPPQQQQQHQQQQQRLGARYIPGAPSFESLRAPSTIRIRRLPSTTSVPQSRPTSQEGSSSIHEASAPIPEEDWTAGRRRSSSAPQSPNVDFAFAEAGLHRQQTTDGAHPRMPAITEGEPLTPGSTHARFTNEQHASPPTTPNVHAQDYAARSPERAGINLSTLHSAQNTPQARSRALSFGHRRSNTASSQPRPLSRADSEYDSDVIDLLDLVDPEVRTIGTLTNLQNSLFVPDLGGLVNRRPTYNLTRGSTERLAETEELNRIARSRANTHASRTGPSRVLFEDSSEADKMPPPNSAESEDIELQPPRRTLSISSQLSDSRYAVLPHGVSLEGWSDADVAELNDHVRHLLHSKREGFKRSMRGFKQYISKPLGLFVFVYAVLVTLFGAAWVFGLIGWIFVGGRRKYIINVIDLVLVALFALVGDGLAPFRAVDTYHMCFIAHYHHLTWRLRREKRLPDLVDHNDLPDRRRSAVDAEIEDTIDKEEMAEFSVLTWRQQKRLQYHQAKFNKSHTFYKPHETATHHAFPIRLLVAVVVLLDCHSLLQVALGTCTWSIDYRIRPEALTATILSCSITCNIVAGVLISVGDHKTRKKNVLERMFRQSLTEQALKRMAKKQERGKLSLAVDRSEVAEGHIKKVAELARPSKEKPRSSNSSSAKLKPEEQITSKQP